MENNHIPLVLQCILLYMSALSQETLVKTGSRSFLGRLVDITEVPFIVIVIPGNKATCTGFIVEKKWVITAAHCFDETRENALVAIGTNERAHGEQKIEAELVILHPRYLVRNEQYDIALIKLKNEIEMTEKSQIIQIENKEWPKMLLRRLCYTAGFGHHINIGLAGVLHGGQVTVGIGPYPYDCPIVKEKVGQLIWTNKNESEPICFGDSGAPLVCDKVAVGVGVISFPCNKLKHGVYCGDIYVDGYVSLYRNLEWLKFHINCLPSSCNNSNSLFTSNQNSDLLLLTLMSLLAVLAQKVFLWDEGGDNLTVMLWNISCELLQI